MILYSGTVVQIGIACLCLIRLGLGVKLEMLETVHEVLNSFDAPLKLTIMSCWDAETKVKFMRYMNTFQVKFITQSSYLSEATFDRHLEVAFDRHLEVIVTDLQCGAAANTISKVSRQMFNYYKVVAFDSSVNASDCSKMYPQMQTLLQDSPVLPSSQFFFICRNCENEFAIQQVYRIGLNEPLIVEDYATYNHTKYAITTTLTPVLRRRNFQGFRIRAAIVILFNDSLNHLDDYRDIHKDAESKLSYQLTKHLISYVNGTVTFSFVPTWGYENKTSGQWTGMIGQVLRNEADIAASGMYFIPERIPIVEYLTRSSTATGGFIFLSPKLSYTSNLYLLPFDRLLWLCSFILVLVMALCLVVAVIFEMKTLAQSDSGCSVSDVPIIIFGALCQQGSAVTPISITGKMVMILSFISFMFLFVSYCANIVALLQSPSNQIRTLQDLYDTKMEFSILDTAYNRHYFPMESEPFRKRFYEERMFDKDGKPKFIKQHDGIKKVREGQHAFYTEHSGAYKTIGETFLDNEKCGLKSIEFFQMALQTWHAIQKNSSYREIFKNGLMRLHEHGLNQRENLRHYYTKPKCSGGGANFVSVNLIDTGPIVMILLCGIGITLTVFILELIVGHRTFLRDQMLTVKTKILDKIRSRILTR